MNKKQIKAITELSDALWEYSQDKNYEPIEKGHPVHDAVCKVQDECYGGKGLPVMQPKTSWIDLCRWSRKLEADMTKAEIETRRQTIRDALSIFIQWAKSWLEIVKPLVKKKG